MFAFRCLQLRHSIQTKYPIRRHSLYHRGVYFFLKKNLLLTNSITSGGFMAIGDLVQQEIEYRTNLLPRRYDWARTGIFGKYLLLYFNNNIKNVYLI